MLVSFQTRLPQDFYTELMKISYNQQNRLNQNQLQWTRWLHCVDHLL